ncbi:glycosyltransferase family 2 protein [Hyphobacterium sp. CCMP332]|nr:glycosyltransferase family 2 protein [Hyphobacterium sp. CCMP332]
MNPLQPEISVIVPLFNEENVIPELFKRLDSLIQSSDRNIEIVLVNDGSKDATAELIKAKSLDDANYVSVLLSRNFGHQIAVSAGMQFSNASKAVLIIDGDLQDPPELLESFYSKIEEGYEVVYAVRKKRKEGPTKKILYWLYYRILRKLSDIRIPVDSGDFCMISKRVNDIIKEMPERSRFVRGIRTWVGFKQIGIEYEREKRFAGEPKYNFKALFKLAYDGIFNFSYVPLKMITRLGLYTILISGIYFTYVLYSKFAGHAVPSGFTSLIAVISLFSGVQMMSLGIIGEYLARIYFQVKERPLFLVDEVVRKEN